VVTIVEIHFGDLNLVGGANLQAHFQQGEAVPG